MTAIDIAACRRWDADAPEVTAFLEWFEREQKTLYRHYLVWLVLNAELSRFVGASPIIKGDAIHWDVTAALGGWEDVKFANLVELGFFRQAVVQRIWQDRHIERHMSIMEAPLREKP